MKDSNASSYATIKRLKQRIAELEEANDNLDKCKRKYHTIFSESHCGIALIDIETGSIIDCNKEFEQLSGRTLDELNKIKIWEIRPTEKVAKAREKFLEIKHEGSGGSKELELQRPNGEIVHVDFLSSKQIIDGREYLLSTARDITRQKEFEHDLKERIKELNCLFNLSNITDRTVITLDEIYLEVANIISKSCQYPEVTCCKITIGGKEFKTSNCRECEYNLSTNIEANGLVIGKLDTSYLKEQPVSDAGPFLEEKLSLINEVAKRLGRITERYQHEEHLKNLTKELRRLTNALQSKREQTRKELAREIHDVLGQQLTALKMDMSLLSNKPPNKEGVLREKTAKMMKTVDMIIQDIRRISMELRPQILEDFGVCAAIEWQLEEFQKTTGIKTKFSSDTSVIGNDFSLNYSTALFRILQEALTNIIRHANATKVDVSLLEKGNNIEFIIRDNGKGITQQKLSDHKAIGLIGIRERVYSLGGKCQINGILGKGTTIKINIPCDIGEGHKVENTAG